MQCWRGRTLHLSHDFDGAAWDLWEQARDLLSQLERDGNLVELPVNLRLVGHLPYGGYHMLWVFWKVHK